MLLSVLWRNHNSDCHHAHSKHMHAHRRCQRYKRTRGKRSHCLTHHSHILAWSNCSHVPTSCTWIRSKKQHTRCKGRPTCTDQDYQPTSAHPSTFPPHTVCCPSMSHLSK